MTQSNLSCDLVIVGNGVLAQATAFELLLSGFKGQIRMVAPATRPGCASLAAGAMLNSFAELEENSLAHEVDRYKFELSQAAANLWPQWIEPLNGVRLGQGTALINNASADGLDDANFDAIIAYLQEFNEPYQEIPPHEIMGYKPSPHHRALRAIYLAREGYVNPNHLFSAFDEFFQRHPNFGLIDDRVLNLKLEGDRVRGIVTEKNVTVSAPQVLLANGAAFSEVLARSQPELKVPRIFFGVGCSLVLENSHPTASHVVRTPNRGMACGIYEVPYGKNQTCVGATNFISPVPDPLVRLTSLEALLKAAMEQLHTSYYRSGLVKMNIGYRPTSADTHPLMGAFSSLKGLYAMSGTKRDGIHMAPYWAKHMANVVMNRNSDERLQVFRPERPLIHSLSKAEAIDKAVKHRLSAAYQHELHLPKTGWEEGIQNFVRKNIEEVYQVAQVSEFGIPPELLDMYRYGHIKA